MKNKRHKKVNYNPFEMFWSWIGVFVFLFAYFIIIISNLISVSNCTNEMIRLQTTNITCNSIPFFTPIEAVLGVIFSIIAGFIIGWIIESLIKYLKYKK